MTNWNITVTVTVIKTLIKSYFTLMEWLDEDLVNFTITMDQWMIILFFSVTPQWGDLFKLYSNPTNDTLSICTHSELRQM